MQTSGQIKARILAIVSGASKRRIRPIDLERTILDEGGSSRVRFKQALSDLVRAKRVVYSYRDPCSFVEMPSVVSELSD